MLTLYALPVSLYSAKTRIALRHKRLAWREELPPGGYGAAEYKRIVASGNLPALVDDGFIIADSEVIAEYLEERFPEPPLLPADPRGRARMRERSRFHDTRLEPALRVLFGNLDPDSCDDDLYARQSHALTERLGQLARIIDAASDLPFGLGDCGLPVTFAWIDALTPRLGLDVAWPEELRRYQTRTAAAPAVAEEFATYLPILHQWLDAKEG